MDIIKPVKRCFKFTQHVFENLNVTYYEATCLTVLWNRHMIFIYHELKLEEFGRELYPEFDISKLFLSSNYIICLDFSGNVHIIPLKFKQYTSRISCPFQPRLQNVVSVGFSEDYVYSIKLVPPGNYFISQHTIHLELITEKEIDLITVFDDKTDKNNMYFNTYSINESDFNKIKYFFKEDTWNQQVLILLSLDKLTIYAFLHNNSILEKSVKPTKLFTCPSKISDICIFKSDVLISLSIGTIIKIPLKTNEIEVRVHLNSAIYKLSVYNDHILYTDGNNLWKVENAFSNDITLKKYFVKNIKDFCCIKDQVICTTFNNILYLFNHNKHLDTATKDYVSSEIVFSNSDCLKKIKKETEKSAEIVSKINKTKNYITTLALSAKQDVMDDIINYNVTLYENFENILKENLIISLVDNIQNYYYDNLKYLLVKILTSSLQLKFSEILSHVFGDLKIHITVRFKTDILKTVTISVVGQLKKLNIVIPLKYSKITNQITVTVKLITKLPGVFNNDQPLWTILHKKDILLNSEHFIKTYKPNTNIVLLNNERNTSEDLLYKNAVCLWSHLLSFNKICVKSTEDWCLFINLQENYEQLFRKTNYLKENLNLQKAESISKLITQEGFLKAKNEICFDIGNEVKIEIIKDGFSKPLLKISSQNLELAFNVKLFFANLIYFSHKELPGLEYVDQAVYSSVDNLEQAMKKVLLSHTDEQEMKNLFEQFQKVLCNLLI